MFNHKTSLRERPIEDACWSPEREAQLDREGEHSECALGVFVWNGADGVSYYHKAKKLQESQGAARGGGGSGLVMDAMTQDRALAVMKGAHESSKALRVFGHGGNVDFSEARRLHILQLHMQGHDLDHVLAGIRSTGAKPLYVERILTNPGALSFRTYRGTYGDIPPRQIPETFVRVFVDNPTPHPSVELEQQFNVNCPGPVLTSWSPIREEYPGLLCFRLSGPRHEFDELFRPELTDLTARQFGLHDRYPTRQSKPGVENSQPQVQGDIYGMHNGDAVSAYLMKQRLRDPHVHHYERLFFERYGKQGVRPQKFEYRHIPSVDSAVVPRLYAYLSGCCKRHGIDPLVISFFEHPPSVSQIEVMPERERHFYTLARLAFFDFSYQGSAATIVGMRDTIRITPDRTRVVWAARDYDGNTYVTSNGGAIMNACLPEEIAHIRPVSAGKVMDIDVRTGALVNRGLEFHIPRAENEAPPSIFIPGAGFDATRLSELQMDRAAPRPSKKPLPKKEEIKIPLRVSNAFGLYGFKEMDVNRLVEYGNTGSYQAIGLGNPEPDGVFGRATSVAELSSEHKAFIVSPGRDYRIEFSGRVILANGDDEPFFLSGPVLFGSNPLAQDPGGKAFMAAIAKKSGTICVDDLKNARCLRTAYSPDQTLEDALKRLAEEALSAAREDGVFHLILDDAISGDEIPMPPDLACAVVHQALSGVGVAVEAADGSTLSESLRSRVNIIGNFNGIRNAEELKECILHGANAVCPRLALDASLGLFTEELNGHLTARREQLFKQGINAILGMNEDLAIAAGSSGFHDMMTLVGGAAGMEYETGIAPDFNALLGRLSGMDIGGVDLKTLDLFLRSRKVQFGTEATMSRRDLLRYEAKWERWSQPVKELIKTMATQGANFAFNPSDYTSIPPTTLEDLVQIKDFAQFKDFPDEELRGINLSVLDFMAASIGHMSIGADNVETWLAMLAAVYEIRHEAQTGQIPFLNEDEALISAGIGEGGIAADFRMFLMHLCGQYASGRFGLTTNDGDIFDRQQLLKEGLLRIKGIQDDAFDETEIGTLEGLVAKLIGSKHIVADLAALEEGKLQSLCRFISVISDKNAQDAKRGYGGMLFKTIFLIAQIRGVTPHDAIKSFFNHPDGDSIEELRQRIFTLMREASGEIPELGDGELGLWSKAANDPYAGANRFGEVKAGAVLTDLDWRGGTGNRPVGTKRSSHPWIAEAGRFDALEHDMLGMMTVDWGSSNRTPVDWYMKALTGRIDAAMLSSSLLGAMGCIFGPCRNCQTGMCGPILTDQREERRKKLRAFDPDAPDDPASREDNVKTKKERAKRFLLAFMRTQKVLMKNHGANTIEQLKRLRGVLEIKEGVQVEGAEWIRRVENHPYDEATVERACSVSDRLDMAHLLHRDPFPEQEIATLLERYLALPAEGVSDDLSSRNAFLVIGDIINAFPALSIEQRGIYFEFVRTAFEKLRVGYEDLSRDQLLERYRELNHLTDRPKQEVLERIITANRILELLSQFCEDGNEHTLRDLFFSRTRHSSNSELSIKSPRAIVSQQNLFTLDTYQGAQRRVAAAVLDHIKTKAAPEPLIIEIDEILTDKDTGILSCLGAIAHHFPEEFKRSVERIEVRLKRGVAGHNLGALVNGNYLFGPGQGREKIKIVVGDSEFPAHCDGSVGMSANGLTVEVHGYISDCGGACASDLTLSTRGASVKLGMGLKGNSMIYCHDTLPSVTGIGMTGNATIITAGARRTDGPRKPMAKPGSVGGDMQGLAKIVLPASLEHIRLAQLLGVGTQAKRLSRLDERQIEAVLAEHYPHYTDGRTLPPALTRKGWSKIVSTHYYRNLVTSLLVFDFYKMRDDHPYEAQLESAAGELLEKLGVDDRDPANVFNLQYTIDCLSTIKQELMATQGDVIKEDPDKAFLAAREMALSFLETFTIPESVSGSNEAGLGPNFEV